MSALIAVPMQTELQVERDQHVSAAESLTVCDQSSYNQAAAMCLGLAGLRRKIVDHHAEMKARTFQSWKAVCLAEGSLLKPVEEAETTIKAKLGAYELAQQQAAEQAERQAREDADRLAAEQMEQQIEDLEATGADAAEIQAVINQPVIFAKPVTAPTLQRVAGISTRKTYKAEVTDIRELARAVAEGRVPSTYLVPNESVLNAVARAQGPEMQRFVPGCRAVVVASVSARRQ